MMLSYSLWVRKVMYLGWNGPNADSYTMLRFASKLHPFWSVSLLPMKYSTSYVGIVGLAYVCICLRYALRFFLP